LRHHDGILDASATGPETVVIHQPIAAQPPPTQPAIPVSTLQLSASKKRLVKDDVAAPRSTVRDDVWNEPR
jgi:hypothetical protein